MLDNITNIDFWVKVLTDPAHIALLILIGICFYIYHKKLVKPKIEEIKGVIFTESKHEAICNKNFKELEALLDRKFAAADLVRRDDIKNLAETTAATVQSAKEQMEQIALNVNTLLAHALDNK
jgi:hypothetical protein